RIALLNRRYVEGRLARLVQGLLQCTQIHQRRGRRLVRRHELGSRGAGSRHPAWLRDLDGPIDFRRPARETAPGSDCGFGFLDVYEKGAFAVVAAPASTLEQLGEVFQPLLGQRLPARGKKVPAGHVDAMSHEPARKEKNGRGT